MSAYQNYLLIRDCEQRVTKILHKNISSISKIDRDNKIMIQHLSNNVNVTYSLRSINHVELFVHLVGNLQAGNSLLIIEDDHYDIFKVSIIDPKIMNMINSLIPT